ncbi:MAG: glycine cleavage system protein H [Acidimicrobiales bacterium]
MPEASWRGCAVPDGVLYDLQRDVWVRQDGDEVVVGMTDVAQTMCGRLVQVTWKKPGSKVKRGRPLAVIESAKWVGPFASPLTGEIVADNRAEFDRDIAAANRDPYGYGWLVRLRPADWSSERMALVGADVAYEQYRERIDTEDLHCYRCVD